MTEEAAQTQRLHNMLIYSYLSTRPKNRFFSPDNLFAQKESILRRGCKEKILTVSQIRTSTLWDSPCLTDIYSQEKPWKQANAITPISQFLTINSYRASRFSRFFLVWCKPEVRRLFLLRLRLAEACFGARRSRRRNKGRSPCITARVLFVFVRIGTG